MKEADKKEKEEERNEEEEEEENAEIIGVRESINIYTYFPYI